MLYSIYEFAMCIYLSEHTKTWYIIESKAMCSRLRDFLLVSSGDLKLWNMVSIVAPI
jgi:hypothetical protein